MKVDRYKTIYQMYLQVMEWGIVLWTWTIPLLRTHHHCKPHMVVQCPSSSGQQYMADHCTHISVHYKKGLESMCTNSNKI